MKIKVLLTIGAMSLLFVKASHAQDITFDVNHFNVTTPFGNIDLGAQNDNWAHIYTDRPKFIVNKPLYIIGGTLSSYSTSNLRFQTNGSSRMTILNSNGNVGIGHTTPDMKLDVRSDGEFVTRFHHNGTSHISGVRIGRTSSFGDLVTLPTGFGIGTGTSGTGLPLNSQSSSHIDFFITNSTGNVGIGTTTPLAKLDVEGGDIYVGANVSSNGERRQLRVYGYDANMQFYGSIHSNWEDTKRTFDIYTNNATQQIKIDASANSSGLIALLPGTNSGVGIGTTNTFGYKLAVDGHIISEELKVKLSSAWPDYVFTPSYNLQSLSEVESFINENGHLPNIPSAQEVEENNGIELGAMNAKLLEKIEELTLHLINKDKQVTNLEQQNAQLEATLTQVLKRLEKIESSVEK